MFWPFVLVTGPCIALLELGAATLMVNVLSLALAGSLLVIAGIAALELRGRAPHRQFLAEAAYR
jgi:hypothetical protein